ncbi:hypothetical protein HYS72_00890 [Candidatus Pacearchaeota archaeon]|nr:hypothetical protein [Candidatus Pacearchaeota archaeon]MBI2057150.1 hypothetical protein [Candidatus Pacearchaeota archaeon]
MEVKLLKEIGLTETEIKIYVALLSLGATSAGKIFDETGIHRKNLYDALNKLISKGLATYVKENKIKFFQAKNPKNLLNYIEEQKSRIEEKKTAIQKIIPELTEKFNSLTPEIEAEIYRGEEGIKTILKDCLNYKEILMIGATGDVENRLPYFWPQYNKKREKLKCKWKLLLVHEAKEKSITKSKYYEYKVLPKILSGLNVIYIYGDYVANILWLEKPLAFVIKHKELAKNYRKYFDYLWKTIK